ncbi:MAG: hypothetical protein O9267_00125 [Flavobacterium sp.]|jgi:hypothetical protein|uniref:hypothetical protein n=1 Tax=Flavobacterium sp. TaxID=239 RepID=UPI0022BFF79B|nr:hypothetical protein [Flavobacterium sp.]MCZ8195994.1 hypothetical protein [Flavobacterium sp.]
MNKLFFITLLFSSFLWSQEVQNQQNLVHPDFAIGIVTNNYFGENYLSKGHQNRSIGIQIKSNWIHYNDFSLGIGLEKSTQKVIDKSIGGNIDKSNTNSIFGTLSYKIPVNNELIISPELNYGGIELRQKSGGKFYGEQNGTRYGAGININYMFEKYFSIYSNVSYSDYNFNTKTSQEYLDYFKNATAISISIGIKFHS